jgi:GWxTD domain-containing protein
MSPAVTHFGGSARFLAALFLCVSLGTGFLHAVSMDVPVPEWREGPVRYLLTKTEAQAYKKLSTKRERRQFIEQFWRRRDPEPGASYNKFRNEFWKRVRQANELFQDQPHEGWITDRGKIYVLLGPPNEIISDEVARSHRGIIMWVYRSTWLEILGPNVVVAFAKDVTGAFRISTSPSTDADVFKGLPLANTPAHLAGAEGYQRQLALSGRGTDPLLVAQGVASGMSELSMLADLGRLQQTDHLILSEVVTAQALFGALPVIASSAYYKADDGTTYTALNVFLRSKSLQFREVGGMQLPHVSVYARLEDPDTGELRYSFERENDFVPASDNASAGVNDYLVFQAGAGVVAGDYKAQITVHDRVAAKTGTYVIDLSVPDFYDKKLALSSLTLAERLSARAEMDAGPLKKPYVFGRLEVIPKPGVGYAKDQEFAFYFQVYNARKDAQTKQPLLDIRYQFLARNHDEEFEPVGQPLEMQGQTSAAQGTSFPLADWPIGTYRLDVRVTDRLSGQSAERSVEFLVR